MLASAGEVAADLEVAVNDEVKLLNRQAQSRARRAVNIMRNSAFDVLGQDGHGRRYGKHTASAPGEAPAPDTGNLRRNWRQYVLAKRCWMEWKLHAGLKVMSHTLHCLRKVHLT